MGKKDRPEHWLPTKTTTLYTIKDFFNQFLYPIHIAEHRYQWNSLDLEPQCNREFILITITCTKCPMDIPPPDEWSEELLYKACFEHCKTHHANEILDLCDNCSDTECKQHQEQVHKFITCYKTTENDKHE